jgi:hypothetical protein
MPQYEIALTIKYHEMQKEDQDKIALAPMQSYATFPLDGVGEEYNDLRFNTYFSMPENVVQWKIGDWAIGVPHTVNDVNTYKILSKYKKFVMKGDK